LAQAEPVKQLAFVPLLSQPLSHLTFYFQSNFFHFYLDLS